MSTAEIIQKISVVHVIDRLHTGGAERVLVTLANIFHRQGHRVKVVTIAGQGPMAAQLDAGIELVDLGRRFKFDPFVMHKLIQHVRAFDVVHVHSFFNLRYLWLAKMLFGLKRPVFYHEHLGFRANMQPTHWQKYILPKTIFIATTAQINNWAGTKLGMAQNRVFTLPNIVLMQPREPVSLDVQENKGPRPNVRKLVLVSNIRMEKNIEFAITLIGYLNRDARNYHLTIVGKLSGAAYYAKLLQLSKETGTESYITWEHNADNVQHLLAQFDCGLHTSASESGPLAVIEYLAQGLPFVAFNTGEVIATIKPELEGCVAFSFSPDEWEQKINRLLSAERLITQQQLKTVFEKHFSAEAYYRRCLEIYTPPPLHGSPLAPKE